MRPGGRRCAWKAVATLALPGAWACQGAPIETSSATRRRETWPTPATDVGSLCADIGPLRACWDDPAAALPVVAHLIPRVVPAVPVASPRGWRCAGQGPARTCADRTRSAPPFTCDGNTCSQRHPRMPDDGEWICAEMAGAVICAGGEPPAGVAPAAGDPAWLCGTRRGEVPGGDTADGGGDDGAGPRVCVDFAPDFPDGNLGAWRCRHVNQPLRRRVCERRTEGTLALLADACDRTRPCIDGGVCVAGRCLPERPSPSCWLDTDCPRGACRFGSCRGEQPR